MYKNIGKKIKIVAVINCIISSLMFIGSAITLFVLAGEFYDGEVFIAAGIFTLIGGIIFSWVGSFVLYGFGELIDKSSTMDAKLAYLIKMKQGDVPGNAPYTPVYEQNSPKSFDPYGANPGNIGNDAFADVYSGGNVSQSKPVSFFCTSCGNKMTATEQQLNASPYTTCTKCGSQIKNASIVR